MFPYSRSDIIAGFVLFIIYTFYQQQQIVNANVVQNVIDMPRIQFLEIVSSAGFMGEMYQIKNQKHGGVATIYHMINPLADQTTLIKYPMLVGHGILSDATMMVSNYENVVPRKPLLDQPTFSLGDESVGFGYANNNFDVWVFDNRGSNRYSHAYINDLNPLKSQSYYNFSADEQALEDLPAFIDFVLEQTQSEKLFYTGYSESTLFLLALLSTKPEYQLKIANAVLLGPIAYLSHIRGSIDFMKPLYFLPDGIEGNVMPEPFEDIVLNNIRRLCSSDNVIGNVICQFFSLNEAGFGETEYNKNFYSSLLKGTSLKSLKHYAQLFFEHRFGMYNYGLIGNLLRYGSPKPPDYDISKVKLPTIIMARGGRDYLSTVEDQQTLLDRLGTKPYLDIFLPTYNHLDYLIGKDVIRKIRMPVLKALYECLRSMTILNGDTTFLRMKIPIRIHEPIRTTRDNFSEKKEPIQTNSNFFNGIITGLGEEDLIKKIGLNDSLTSMKSVAIKIDRFTDTMDNLRDTFINTVFKPLNIGSG